MRNRTIMAVLTAGLTLAASAQAAEPQQAINEVTYAGVRVAIDPQTGKIRPLTAAENKALSDAVLKGRKQASRIGNQPRNATEAGATRRVHADGSVSIRLPADQMTEMSGTIGTNGQVTISEDTAQAVHKEELK